MDDNRNPNRTLPPPLVSALKDRRVVLFLGAGASLEARTSSRAKPPTGYELRDLLCDRFFGGEYKSYDLASAADFAIERHGSIIVNQFIKDMFDAFLPSKPHLDITRFFWSAIATTNYDLLIERSYEATPERKQNPVVVVGSNDPVDVKMRSVTDPVEVIKLHGCITRANDTSVPLILSEASYDTYLDGRKRLFQRLEDKAYENVFVFCGYRIADSHIRKLMQKILPDGVTRPTHYIVCPGVSDVERSHWAAKKIEVIDLKFGEFMELLDQELPEFARDLHFVADDDGPSIRANYRAKVVESDQLGDYLTRQVTHVRHSMEVQVQDPKAFYLGFDTGWACMKDGLTIPRGVVDDVLYEIISAESDLTNTKLLILKGPVGNGKTIALKQVSWELSGIGKTVVAMNDGGVPSGPELEELSGLVGDRVFVAVDQVSQCVGELKNAIQHLCSRNVPVTFIATETDADWNNYCDPIAEFCDAEFRVRYLSRREIEALIEKLERHQSLGDLERLSKEKRIECFEERAERQLLVALHEATKGKRFEEVVIEEHSRLPADAAKLYLDVCTLHQFGVGARAGTVGRLSGITFPEYQENLFKPLENIVQVRRDQVTGDYAYFARHAKIADFVFRGVCGDDSSRAEQLIRMLRSLDIGYSSDRTAFERLTRGHSLIRRFDSAEHIRALFEVVADISTEPFISQQWAIFESTHKDGDFDIAREQIELAKSKEPHNPTIQHTDAELSRKAARVANSPREAQVLRMIAREKLGEMRDQKSRYVFSSRVKLLLDELEEVVRSDEPDNGSLDQAVEIIERLESFLEEATRRYPDDPEFHECDARFKAFLGDGDKVITAFNRAIARDTQNPAVAIGLAKALERKGDWQGAVDTLAEALQKNPDIKRHHFELGRLLINGKTLDLKSAVSHFSQSYDLLDDNHEARFWHAMTLYFSGEIPESLEVFEAIDKAAHSEFRKFPTRESNSVEKKLPRYVGKVLNKNESFAFVEQAKNPQHIYANERNSEQSAWNRLVPQMPVTFEVRFSRRGPQAYDLQII
ncbi:Flp pilus assembly protein TadD, contains TPR repeats [Roseovarius azorensis]|uniref:Flp pilus assembly protein TadD, contains TPR repeats n=1 Tax=Roseovarius azorensis TaxID=1287727 RepID=A0A1H7XIF6_9RHOB|nr:SIR2 family protein [Roseovarius azorensis]SEM33394.1 Flp pilus assembly protein TadD, contains TPR repeats [Roseovarius azorensis]